MEFLIFKIQERFNSYSFILNLQVTTVLKKNIDKLLVTHKTSNTVLNKKKSLSARNNWVKHQHHFKVKTVN